nr:DUF6531 domain-containing protein [uncultured Capnocytophaga sp.]
MPTHSTYSSSVDVATGAVLSYGFDFYLNGVIPLEIERLWFSDSDFSGRLGYGVHSILDIQLKIDEESIGLLTKEGDSISFPRFFSPEETYLNITEQMEARCTAEGEYYIWNRKEDLYYYFTKEKNEEKNTFYTKEADMALYNADLNRY